MAEVVVEPDEVVQFHDEGGEVLMEFSQEEWAQFCLGLKELRAHYTPEEVGILLCSSAFFVAKRLRERKAVRN